MQTAGWQPQYNIAGLNCFPGNYFVFFHRAADDAHQVVLTGQISVRHFGRFATDQRYTCFPACLYHPGNNLFDNFRLQSVIGDVVQEGEGSGSHDNNIVGAGTYEVDADSVILAQHPRYDCLCADAINALNQNRVIVLVENFFQIEEGTEAADAGEDIGVKGGFHLILNAGHRFISGIDIHTG